MRESAAGARGTLSDQTLFLINYSEGFIYAGLFLLLFLCGLGLPIPEELTLLTGGFFVHLGIIRFYPTLAIGFFGILGVTWLFTPSGRSGARTFSNILICAGLSRIGAWKGADNSSGSTEV